MNWISEYVRPKLKALVSKKSEVPDNYWQKCPSCGEMIPSKELKENLSVCHHCDYHFRISSTERLSVLFDNSHFTNIDLPKVPDDPLKFRDSKKYIDRLKTYRHKTERTDAIQVGIGKIGGKTTVVAAFDFYFMGGSMGMAVGEGIVRAAETAVEKKAPLVIASASGGARMQEGILSLMQMPRTTIATQLVKEAGLPYIALLSDPTTGGVSASFAMLSDIAIAEPKAIIGFAGSRVIEETIREKLPEGFQRSEYLREHGMVDMVVSRKDLKAKISSLLGLLTK